MDKINYEKLIEMNDDIFCIKSFIKVEHSDNETKDFFKKYQKKYSLVIDKINVKEMSINDTLNALLRILEHDIEIYYDKAYFFNEIKLNKKYKLKFFNFINYIFSVLKRKFVNGIIFIIAITLITCNYYFVDKESFFYSLLFAISTGLLASCFFDFLSEYKNKMKKELKNEKICTINQINNLQLILDEDYQNLKNDVSKLNLELIIRCYSNLYHSITKLSKTTNFFSSPIETNMILFINYYIDNFITINLDKFELNEELIKKAFEIYPTVRELLDNIKIMNNLY